MNEIYWITRLDYICNTLALISILSVVASGFLIIGLVNFIMDGDPLYKTFKKALKISLFTFISSSIINIFIPKTNEAYIIYGIGGTIDYIKSDSVASKLPHKAIIALDKYLENINNNSTD